MDYRDAINKVLQHEGGYVNHPADKGGPTNWGVTQGTYNAFMTAQTGKPYFSTIDEIRLMPIANALIIYKTMYWDKVRGDQIKRYSMALAIFDQAINRGISAASKQAQRVLKNTFNHPNMVEDGNIGPATVAALNTVDEKKFLDSYLAESILAYNKIVQNNPSQVVFLNGWLKRVESLRKDVISKLGTINSTSVSIGIGVILTLSLGSYLIYKYGLPKVPKLNAGINLQSPRTA